MFLSDNTNKYFIKTTDFIIDGTLYSVPRDFYQLISIHGIVFEKEL